MLSLNGIGGCVHDFYKRCDDRLGSSRPERGANYPGESQAESTEQMFLEPFHLSLLFQFFLHRFWCDPADRPPETARVAKSLDRRPLWRQLSTEAGREKQGRTANGDGCRILFECKRVLVMRRSRCRVWLRNQSRNDFGGQNSFGACRFTLDSRFGVEHTVTRASASRTAASDGLRGQNCLRRVTARPSTPPIRSKLVMGSGAITARKRLLRGSATRNPSRLRTNRDPGSSPLIGGGS